MKRICLLGASRGLGWSTYLKWKAKTPQDEFLLVARKVSSRVSEIAELDQHLDFDFTKQPTADLLQAIRSFNPTHIIYLAGGGPYGSFSSKKWADHLWSLKLNFLFPAELLHQILCAPIPDLQSMTFIGSSIAESAADAQAASYAAGKHALKGLITSIQTEKSASIAIKLFSPGYMDTNMLPANSAPRLQGLTQSPEVVAEQLIKFIESPSILKSSDSSSKEF